MHYKVKKIVSNLPGQTKTQDTLLVNPWGITIKDKTLWVSDNGSGVLTNYDLKGNKISSVKVAQIPMGLESAPTGIIVNNTENFRIGNGSIFVPATLLIATESNTVNAYNPYVDYNNAKVVIDGSSYGSVYKGLAIAGDLLLVADFMNGIINIYDKHFNLILFKGSYIPFSDPTTQFLKYNPFNIVNIKDKIYILYAKQNSSNPREEQPGIGYGYINEFSLSGEFIRKFANNGELNAPWGMVEAPKKFGYPKGTLLVSNFGDGKINAYSNTGCHLGQLKLKNKKGDKIVLEGLWGLTKHHKHIYFASGPEEEENGMVGKFKKH